MKQLAISSFLKGKDLKIRRVFILSGLFLTVACSEPEWKPGDVCPRAYLYHNTITNSDMAFDREFRILSLGGGRGLTFEECSTETVFCIGQGLFVEVPKTSVDLDSWSSTSMNCKIEKSESFNSWTILCRPDGRQEVRLTYSQVRGVTVFTDFSGTWSLRSKFGLFAPKPCWDKRGTVK